MLEKILEHVRRRDSFAFETTLSGRMYAIDNSWRTPILIEGGGHAMSSEKPDSTAGVKERDPDLINAEIALKRAALKARQLAQQAGLGVIVLQDGKIVEERPDHED